MGPFSPVLRRCSSIIILQSYFGGKCVSLTMQGMPGGTGPLGPAGPPGLPVSAVSSITNHRIYSWMLTSCVICRVLKVSKELKVLP